MQSNRDEHFLLVNGNDNNIIMFSTITNLKSLSEIDSILLDETF